MNPLATTKRNHQHNSGFTLIELLVIIGILAIIIPLMGNSMRGLVVQTQLKEAQSQIVADLTKAKTASIRYSTQVIVTFDENTYTLTQQAPFTQQTIKVKNNATLSFYKSDGSFGTSQTSLAYSNPYGEVSLPENDQGWQIRVAKGNRDYFINIVGLTGKVIVNNDQ